MAAAELVTIPAFEVGHKGLSVLHHEKDRERKTQPAIQPLSPWLKYLESDVDDPTRMYEETVEELDHFSRPLLPLLEKANLDLKRKLDLQRRTDLFCRLFEYQCAVFQNTESYLRGAEDVYSVLDVKISRREEVDILDGVALRTVLKRRTLTDLDIVTVSKLPNGRREIVVAECSSSGDDTLAERHMNTVKGKPKPGEVKIVYDGAATDERIYRIPLLAMHIDSYVVMVGPTRKVPERMVRHVDEITRPLVEKYRPQLPPDEYTRPAISIVHAPIQWTHDAKRWHIGMPQQTPAEMRALIKRLIRYPVKGIVKERLTNAEDYRGPSSPLFRPAYSSQ